MSWCLPFDPTCYLLLSSSHSQAPWGGLQTRACFSPKIRVKGKSHSPPPPSVDDVSKVRHGLGEVIPASELETKFSYPRSQTAAGHMYTSRLVNLNCQLEWP